MTRRASGEPVTLASSYRTGSTCRESWKNAADLIIQPSSRHHPGCGESNPLHQDHPEQVSGFHRNVEGGESDFVKVVIERPLDPSPCPLLPLANRVNRVSVLWWAWAPNISV